MKQILSKEQYSEIRIFKIVFRSKRNNPIFVWNKKPTSPKS